MTTVTLTIPDELYEQAQAAGILTDELLVRFIQKELERRLALERFFETVDKLRAVQPPITQEEIDAELEAYYTGKYGTKSERLRRKSESA